VAGEPEAADQPAVDEHPAETTPRREEPEEVPLLAGSDAERFEVRWAEIQAGFVDEPREAVTHADELVAELMRHLAEVFSTQRSELEATFSGGDASTEDLRMSLKRYRSFFHRLLRT
jgi:hypothetical protein